MKRKICVRSMVLGAVIVMLTGLGSGSIEISDAAGNVSWQAR